MKYRLFIGSVLVSIALLVAAAAPRIIPVTATENGALYDPTNFFLINSNIPPSSIAPGTGVAAYGVLENGRWSTNLIVSNGITGIFKNYGYYPPEGNLTVYGDSQTTLITERLFTNNVAVALRLLGFSNKGYTTTNFAVGIYFGLMDHLGVRYSSAGAVNVGWESPAETNTFMSFYASRGQANATEKMRLTSAGTLIANNGYMLPTNSVSLWPTAPSSANAAFIGNSNGVPYMLTSTGTVWTATNVLNSGTSSASSYELTFGTNVWRQNIVGLVTNGGFEMPVLEWTKTTSAVGVPYYDLAFGGGIWRTSITNTVLSGGFELPVFEMRKL